MRHKYTKKKQRKGYFENIFGLIHVVFLFLIAKEQLELLNKLKSENQNNILKNTFLCRKTNENIGFHIT
jgi:hypothetical protein